MAERLFTVAVEREDAETLLLDGLALARAFFTGDPSSQPGGYDSRVGLANHDRILVEDIVTVNTTMRARSSHASWHPVLVGDQSWLRSIPFDLDIIEADDAEWEAVNGDALLSAAIAACIHHGIGLASATKVLHLKRPRLVPILDRLVAEMLGLNPPDGPTMAGRVATGQRLTAAVRREGRRNIGALHNIRTALANDGFDRSLVRIFDAIIWYSHPAASVAGAARSICVGLRLAQDAASAPPLGGSS
jgi:hypothetical protein